MQIRENSDNQAKKEKDKLSEYESLVDNYRNNVELDNIKIKNSIQKNFPSYSDIEQDEKKDDSDSGSGSDGDDTDDESDFKSYKDDMKSEDDLKSFIKNNLSQDSQDVINENNSEFNEIIEKLKKKGISKDKAIELSKLKTIGSKTIIR